MSGPAPPPVTPVAVAAVTPVAASANASPNPHLDHKHSAAPPKKDEEDEWSKLFVTPQESETAILLVDASGSVRSNFSEPDKTVFDECRRLAKTLPHKKFKVLYWNSYNIDSGGFKGGILKLPFVLTPDKFDSNFAFAFSKITNQCLTYPNLAFANIDDWLSSDFSKTVYLLTDGQMGHNGISAAENATLQKDVANSIQALVKKFPDVQIHILAVEERDTDYSAVENLQLAAGCDLFKLVQEQKLTKSIASFTSYTPKQSQGYSHIKRVRAPPGCIPFRNSYFSERHLHKFISWLRSQVAASRENQEALLKLIQDLSVTAAALMRDKIKALSKIFLNIFCDIFENTSLDNVLVRFILSSAVEDESAGSAALFASYRSQLKNLYKSADLLLTRDVRAAVGTTDQCITLPMSGFLVSAPADLIHASSHIKGRVFPNSALSWKDEKDEKGQQLLLPVLPLKSGLFDSKSEEASMSEQCLRQWVRAVIGQLCGVESTSDLVVYHVLAFNYQVQRSKAVHETVKQFYRELGMLMLRKKRTQSTELKWLQDGQLPTPSNSGDLEYFKRGMRQICPVVGLPSALKPFSVWFFLCLALKDEVLLKAQLSHCKEDLAADQLTENSLPPIQELKYHLIPAGCALEHTCLIHLEDLTHTGGYGFKPHGAQNGCKPRHMLGEKGLNQLLSKPETALCPVCYTPLSRDHFVQFSPNDLSLKLEVLAADLVQLSARFSDNSGGQQPPVKAAAPAAAAAKDVKDAHEEQVLLFLRGTVGCGKSTYTSQVVSAAMAKDYVCFVANVDCYACVDNNAAAAVKRVTADLAEFLALTKGKKRLVVVDTCGEITNAKKVFGQDLSGWKVVIRFPNKPPHEHMTDYLSWSLHNVCLRPASSEGCGFWLNPVGAGLETCRSVHLKKAIAVFGKQIVSKWRPPQAAGTKAELVSALAPAATRYAQECLNLAPVIDFL